MVVVAAFGVHYLADVATTNLLDGLNDLMFEAGVLEHEALSARLPGSGDELADVVHRHCGRNLNGSIFAVAHRLKRNGRVGGPVAANVHEIHILLPTCRLIRLLTR